MSTKPTNYGDIVRVDEPSGVGNVPVQNGMIYVKVYARGDTPILGSVYAASHTTAAPSDDVHNIGDALNQIPGTYDWEGCISAPLGSFYVTACAEFEDADNPMSSHHVPKTTVQLNGVEGEEPRCG